jgi:hypothetical protein
VRACVARASLRTQQAIASLPPTVDNVRLISTMTREPSELGFHAIPCAMQARAGPLVCRLFLVDVAMLSGAVTQVTRLLDDLAAALRDFRVIFGEVTQRVAVDKFYDIYRPLLGGFYPHGVTFRGVPASAAAVAAPQTSAGATSGDSGGGSGGAGGGGAAGGGGGGGDLVSFSKGPSAGQSAMILLFDLALGITHRKESGEFQVSSCKQLVYLLPRARGHTALCLASFVGFLSRASCAPFLSLAPDDRYQYRCCCCRCC